MSKYINKAKLAERLLASPIFKNTQNGDLIRDTVIDIVLDYPTADVVEVVRCKDCKHYIANYCTRDIKGRTNMFYMLENDYCSYGERSKDTE